MSNVISMAVKDLRILFRDRAGSIFIVVFPVLMGVFFGLMMGGFSEEGRGKMRVAIVDQDNSQMSAKFVDSLESNEGIRLEPDEFEAARESVRLGKRVAMLAIPEGFGENAGVLWGDPPKLQLGVDPSRAAESGMLQGLVMQAIGGLVGERFNDPATFTDITANARPDVEASDEIPPQTKKALLAFFDEVEDLSTSLKQVNEAEGESGVDNDSTGVGGGMQFADIESIDLSRQIDPSSTEGQVKKLKSRWDISFPQAMMWGILGCIAGFSASIARERTMGTMTRLQAAPVSRFQILAGKALACFLTTIGVISALTILGVALGMRPGNYLHLAIAALCVAICFVGIMMTFSVLGKTEQSVGGIGWAINMVMAMIGGCMIPVMFMPDFMQKLSVLSPIRWGILAIEGAIWREFTFHEMVFPCVVLLSVGVAGLAMGTTILNRQ